MVIKMCLYILSIMWNETRNTICFFVGFYDCHFREYPSRLFLLMISVESSQGWDSLKHLFLADRPVSMDKRQHSFSFDSLCHSEVVIWTFHISVFFNWRNLKDFCGNLTISLHCSWILQTIYLVIIYVDAIDFLPPVLLWHFLGTNFSSGLQN